MRQVIMNLIINASEAMNQDTGAISIATGTVECKRARLSKTLLGERLPNGLYVYLEVVDSGSGMDEETLGKIFDPFFTTKFAGRGLGLATVLGILRGHKGTIEVDSRLGEGTTVRVLFPASRISREKIERKRARSSQLQEHGTILLVDDEEMVLVPAKRMLELLGFKVLTAADGHQAIEIFRAHQDEIACVVLDLTMPQMDGPTVLKELRRIKPDLPVILSSGYSEPETKRRLSGENVASFIQKPYQLRVLAKTIGDIRK